MKTKVAFLECGACQKRYKTTEVHNLCDCGGPLFVRYDLETIRHSWKPQGITSGPHNMWRYAPVLPAENERLIITFGEGMTPMRKARRLGAEMDLSELWIKDEGLNPTGSLKARDMACAVSMAVELGIRRLAIVSTGNAASALAAYATAAQIEVRVFMPKDAPHSNIVECGSFGAHVTLVDGPAERAPTEGWHDVSALKEPYRVEGRKTLGYELAEQLNQELPDAILYPAGTGVGIIALWKAFEEMEALGWIAGKRPKMVAVQAEGCMPLARAWLEGERHSRPFENAHTIAAALREPKPPADSLALDILRASGGAAITVSDEEILDAGIQLASAEGLLAAPEGASCVAALSKLRAGGFLKAGEKVVIYNTGSGLKYLEAYATRFPGKASGEQDKLGGLITPR